MVVHADVGSLHTSHHDELSRGQRETCRDADEAY